MNFCITTTYDIMIILREIYLRIIIRYNVVYVRAYIYQYI